MKEIVIKIPDKIYNDILVRRIYCSPRNVPHEAFKAIRDGKVLPKGHGRLIDADTLADGFEDNYEFCEALNATPTLVEADKGVK